MGSGKGRLYVTGVRRLWPCDIIAVSRFAMAYGNNNAVTCCGTVGRRAYVAPPLSVSGRDKECRRTAKKPFERGRGTMEQKKKKKRQHCVDG